MFRITLVSNEPPYFPDCFSYFSLHCFPSTFDTVEGVSGDVAALCDCDALQHLQLGGCAGVGGEFLALGVWGMRGDAVGERRYKQFSEWHWHFLRVP